MSVRRKTEQPIVHAKTDLPRENAVLVENPGTAPLFLHICPSFEIGGLQDRLVAIVNDLGPAVRHVILALDGNYACAGRLTPGLSVETPASAGAGSNPLQALWHGYRALRRWKPDLFLTYNWASLEWAAASLLYHPCPHIHHEDGFGPEESDGQLTRRVLFRRVALRRASALVVPSHSLYRLARESWHVRPDILHRIPNGIECTGIRPDGSAREPDSEAQGLVLGSLAPLRREKGLDVLLHLAAELVSGFDLRVVIA
jgi:glycosyltransferase involved in cell wall biosynthesis